MRKALFLDRDGVINRDTNYLYKVEDVEFIDGIFDIAKCFYDKGYIIVVVTNQSGIARGYYDREDFYTISAYMEAEFKKRGATIAKFYFCPHHPDITGACACRKPKSGMFFDAIAEFAIDAQNSVMIGDNESDMIAAENAGIARRYLLGKRRSDAATKVVGTLKEIAC